MTEPTFGELRDQVVRDIEAGRLRPSSLNTRRDLRYAVADLAHNHAPAHVRLTVVLSSRGGWRALVHRACMWVLIKTGHEVMRP